MKKKWFALGMLPILLFAFSAAPARADADLAINVTTTVKADGSGTLDAEVSFSKNAVDWLLTLGMPGFSVDSMCSGFVMGENQSIAWKQESQPGGGTVCSSQATFANLEELKSLTGEYLSQATFTRLEITGGHFYYDLASNSEGATNFGPMSPITVGGSWILKVPGDLLDSNADKVNGLVLTWDLTKVAAGTHFRAESKLGGGLDPTVVIVGGILLLGCCCLVILIAGGAAFFFLRRRKASAAGAPQPAVGS